MEKNKWPGPVKRSGRFGKYIPGMLLLLLLVQAEFSWGQIVLTSTGSSIIKITGLPTAPCNQGIALQKYSSTPQNQPTLAAQIEETLTLISSDDRIKLEAGVAYRYSVQVKAMNQTIFSSPLAGRTHGDETAIIPVYAEANGEFLINSRPKFIQSKAHRVSASGHTQFEGTLTFDRESSKGFLCIPLREKDRNNRTYTTNIIIPFTVSAAVPDKGAATETPPTAKAQKPQSKANTSSEKIQSERKAIRPIIGSTSRVHPVRKSVQPDAGLKAPGKGQLLTFSRNCLIEEEPEEIEQDLGLKVFPNPTSGITRLHYHLPEATDVTAMIYDLQGKAVQALLPTTRQDAGPHQLQWNPVDLPSGMYLVRIQTPMGYSMEKIMVMRDK